MNRNPPARRERYISIVTEADRHETRHIVNAIRHNVALMEARGYSKHQRDAYVFKVLRDMERGKLDEGILDTLGGIIKWASDKKYLQPIQSWIGGKVANLLGLQEGTLMRKIVVNFIENLEVSKVQEMFSGEGMCRPLVSELAGAVQEAVVEQGIQAFGLAPESMMGRVFQETLLAAFAEEGVFVDKVTDVVCSLNVSDIFSGGKTDVKAAITGAAPATA
jgi:hypothetical protein